MNVFSAVRAAYGTVVFAAPRRVLGRYAGHPADRRVGWVGRVLGTRHVVQAVLSSGSPTPAVLLLGAEADLAHAASAVGLAAADRSWRQAGWIEAAIAASFAATGIALARAVGHAVPGRAGTDRGAHIRAVPDHAEPTSASPGTPARLAAIRDQLASWLAGVLVPAAVRRWAAGDEPKGGVR